MTTSAVNATLDFRNAMVKWVDDSMTGPPNVSTIAIDHTIDQIKNTGFKGITVVYDVGVDMATGQVTTPTLDHMWQMVDYAKQAGLEVQIKTCIVNAANHNNLNQWAGFTGSFDTLFNGLNKVLPQVALNAQQHGADVFYVGSENNLIDTSAFHNQWANVITSIRNVFSGVLTYDALYFDSPTNITPHTNDYGVVGIWDLLDAASLSLYPALTSSSSVNTLSQIENLYFNRPNDSNYSVVNDIINLYDTIHKPIYLGETAFNPTVQTLNGLGNSNQLAQSNVALDPVLQATAWTALLDLVGKNLSSVVSGINMVDYPVWALQNWITNPVPGNANGQFYHKVFYDYESNFLSPSQQPSVTAISQFLNQPWDYSVTNLTVGGLRNDIIQVSGGLQIAEGLGGNDNISAINALGIAQYRGNSTEYTVTTTNNTVSLIADSVQSRDGTDTLNNIYRLEFKNGYFAYDTAAGQVAGEAYRLYQAAFDRAPDLQGLGYWINSLDHGSKLVDVSASFIASPEFNTMYGPNSTDTNFVTLLYSHVLHRTPDTEGYNYWTTALHNGASRAAILTLFSESPENVNQTAPLTVNGVHYDLWTA